jgi:hypothetical protein
MGWLRMEIEQFETSVELAHDMVKLRPDLFQDDIAPPAKEPEPSAVPTHKKRAHRKRAA